MIDILDFYRIQERMTKSGSIEVYPDFIVGKSKDLLIKGGKFYAVYDESTGLWSTDEYLVRRILDESIGSRVDELRAAGKIAQGRFAGSFKSQVWTEWRTYCSRLPDSKAVLDDRITFLNDEVKKDDYRSKRLPYSLAENATPAYDELMSTLYEPAERQKLEWGVGAIVCGESRTLQKFFVLFGSAGTGKSTFLNILQYLFDGYYCTFDSKALGNSSSSFATEAFRGNPLLAIQHDGDLSRIEDNTKLNSIVSHEEIIINEKYKSGYTSRINALLFMGSNKPVKITDSKSGIIRRLIDVRPTGQKLSPDRYFELMDKIQFELGAIAQHCLEVYTRLGKNYYGAYRPVDMQFQTDVFFNFINEVSDIFAEHDGVTLQQAYSMYKEYCDEGLVEYRLPKYKFREELKSYFDKFEERGLDAQGNRLRSYYSGFIAPTVEAVSSCGSEKTEDEEPKRGKLLVLSSTTSLLDELLADQPAQVASSKGSPIQKWDRVSTHLRDVDTKLEHFVRLPSEHIVVDFDLKNEKGEKDRELNLAAAAKFPTTYAEFSRGGGGVHLHYIYEGDSSRLSGLYSPGIEVKVFTGNASLRRKLTFCNEEPVAHISSGLPLKGEKVVNFESVKNEKTIRAMILRNLKKEYHGFTKPSVDFIYKILDEAYKSGVVYDVTDLRPKVLAFANNSTNQSEACLKLVAQMKFQSEKEAPAFEEYGDDRLVFYDVEVFPNLFLVNWKYEGPDQKVVRMINPTPREIEAIMRMKLIGFNCRRYDNHILYGRYLGYTNEQLFDLSQRIVGGSQNAMFREAYNISYADVYDFATKKQSLKKYEVELGIHHQELGLPWDQPVPEDKWQMVAEYCDNDVIATEAVFNSRKVKADYSARLILAKLSGLPVNSTTQQHAARIIFGDDPHPQKKFVYTDLSEMFPGYKFENGKSWYRGEDPGEGGEVYAEPGIYYNVALLDIMSMHPTSIELLNLFGPYTPRYSEIKAARIAIKHREIEKARSMLGGILAPYLDDLDMLKDLAYALKIVINIVYGLTSAKFDNKFRDPRNKDNIVAKRGALFMIDLKHAVQEQGFTVAHIKTDSIKIPNATPEIIQFVMDFGKKYGYTFEHEATYERMCLVNDAVYIAKYKDGDWTATGAQFQHPYVFKSLFTKKELEFQDLCEPKAVNTYIYLDFNESLNEDEHDRKFVGKVGLFCPVKAGTGGGVLVREGAENKFYAVTGTKGYRWKEAEVVKAQGSGYSTIDYDYFLSLADDAVANISKYGCFEAFIDCEPTEFILPCGMPGRPEECERCPNRHEDEFHHDCRLGYELT